MMEFNDIKETIFSLEDELSPRMKKYIHYRSFRNFISHFKEIRNDRIQLSIILLLNEYIVEIKGAGYDFDVYSSTELAKAYLFKIAHYYREEAKFVRIIKLPHSLLYGILLDSILYSGNFLSKLYYVPVCTVGFLLYYSFVMLFKVRKERVYGMFY